MNIWCARQLDPDGSFQVKRGHDREEKLVLGTQADAERAADEVGDNPHVLGLQAKHAGDVGLAYSARPGSCRSTVILPVAVPHHRRGVRLHRAMVFGSDAIFVADPVWRGGECGRGVAARLRRWGYAVSFLRRHVGLLARRVEVGVMRFSGDVDPDEGGGVPGGGEVLGHDQGDRLAAVEDAVVEQRPERLAGRGHGVLVVFVAGRGRWDDWHG